MKQLLILCSNAAIGAVADYIRRTFQQDAGLSEVSVLWQGTTVRHRIGVIILEGEDIPERLLDMIYTARDLFDVTEVFEGRATAGGSAPTQEPPPGRTKTTESLS